VQPSLCSIYTDVVYCTCTQNTIDAVTDRDLIIYGQERHPDGDTPLTGKIHHFYCTLKLLKTELSGPLSVRILFD